MAATICTTMPSMSKFAKKSVRFHRIEIIELPIILTDHPSVTRGPPLGVGWDVLRRSVFDFDAHEEQQANRRAPRSAAVISPNARKNM